MQHYGVGEWTDFVRNLVSDQARLEMEQHRANCAECEAVFRFVGNLAVSARDEQVYDAASEVLADSARQAFSTQRKVSRTRDHVIRALQTLVAHLTYDSVADLRPVGARASHATTRQMLYEAGDYCLDLRFDRESESPEVTLVGQVAMRRDTSFQAGALSVLILSDRKVVAKSASNEFGEFSLQYAPARDLRLCVRIVDAGVELEVPLRGVMEQHEP